MPIVVVRNSLGTVPHVVGVWRRVTVHWPKSLGLGGPAPSPPKANWQGGGPRTPDPPGSALVAMTGLESWPFTVHAGYAVTVFRLVSCQHRPRPAEA